MSDERILAIDIGAGTMDVVVHDPAQPMENAVQLVLPSATAILGRRIERAREERRAVFLHGNLMGGYHTTNAVWRHLEAGLPVDRMISNMLLLLCIELWHVKGA